MDDLNEKLERLLSDPQGMAKIQSALSALTGESAPPAPPPAPTPSATDLAAIGRLMPLLTDKGQDSDDTRLLQALRPYLKGQRVKRLDDSMQLLRLVKLLPLLQEAGGTHHGG